ncbi:MAG: ABC transporter ATP-binding protein [Halorhabdus sp.]
MTDEPLVKVQGLKKHFPVDDGFLSRLRGEDERHVKAVDGIDLNVYSGETYGIVGESGSGKSTLGKTILQLIRPTSGEVWFDGERIDAKSDEEVRKIRKDIQYIFQDPSASLNPRRKVRDIVRRPMNVHGIGDSRKDREQRVEDLIEAVGLSTNQLDRYPHEFSGGQQQRIGIARALAVNPRLIVADEPVSALDVTVQAQILNLIEDLKDEFDLTILFIAHDLSVVRHISDRVSVMYLGEIMETGENDEIFNAPKHPYTESLLEAIPSRDVSMRGNIEPLRGEIPSPIDPPSGCKFRTRCPLATERCTGDIPEREFSPTHEVHCIEREPERSGTDLDSEADIEIE